MPKSVPAPLLAVLQQEVPTVALFLKVTRLAGAQHFFTSHDADVPVAGDTYKASDAFTRSAIEATDDLGVNDMQIIGFFTAGEIDDDDIAKGLLDGARVEIFLADRDDPAKGTMAIFAGLFGEASSYDDCHFVIELRDFSQLLKSVVGAFHQATCRSDLGAAFDPARPVETGCIFPVEPALRQDTTAYGLGDFIRVATTAGTGSLQYEDRIYECTTAGTSAATPPVYDTTIGNTTTDGTAVFTAREAFTYAATVLTTSGDGRNFTVDAATFADPKFAGGFFDFGRLVWESGLNLDHTSQVKSATQTDFEMIFQTPFAIQVGDVFRVTAGCDKLRATCRDKFVIPGSKDFAAGNVLNFRGEPDLPGRDVIFRTPDAR